VNKEVEIPEIGKEQALALLNQSFEDSFIFGSGHDIYNMKDYITWGKPAGIKKKHIQHMNQRHYSGDGYKSTIFVNGAPVEYLEGIDNKDILSWFGGVIGADLAQHSWISGRGTWARNVTATIYERLCEIAGITAEEGNSMKAKATDEYKANRKLELEEE
tara:strand:- start:27131 stop:27610 length:480 start_codon:yes stop_codon:yes gene_type:complete